MRNNSPYIFTRWLMTDCLHSRSVEQCHYTYITKYKPSQEEVCDENYEKVCQISYSSRAVNDTVKKCYTPVEKENMLDTLNKSNFDTSMILNHDHDHILISQIVSRCYPDHLLELDGISNQLV